MSRIYFVVYPTSVGFGKTHISIWKEGDDLEWSYGHLGVRSCEVGKFSDMEEGWTFSRMVSVANAPSDLNLKETIDEVVAIASRTFTEDAYHLVNNNCWHFASIVLDKICPKSNPHYLNLIFKINDFEWNAPNIYIFGTTQVLFHLYQWEDWISSRVMHLWDRLRA